MIWLNALIGVSVTGKQVRRVVVEEEEVVVVVVVVMVVVAVRVGVVRHT